MRLFGLIAVVIAVIGAGIYASPHAPWAKKDEAIAQPALEKEPPKKVFDAKEYSLENGMQVIVIENDRAPVVTHMVWYKVGAAEEVAGKSGIAHFTEHLMFKGSDIIGGGTLSPGEFSKVVRRHGGQDNAFTSQDYTAYFQSIASDQLERVMRMEAGRMLGINLTEEEVESERKVILEERRQRTDNDPRGRFGEQMAASSFINHPYGTPVIGWYHEMEGLSREDALAFHDQYYAPNNAILVVSGAVSGDDVHTLAKDIYGGIPANDTLPERVRTVSPVLNSQTSVNLEHPVIREPIFQILYRVPSYRQDADRSLAIQVLEEIMGGGPTSRLYRALVVEQGIAVNAGLSYSPYAWDDARLWVYATPTPEQTTDIVLAALHDEFRDVIENGVSDAELNDAITRMQDAAVFARDSLSGPAMVIGQALATGASLDDVEFWPARLEGVTAEDVRAAADAFLNPDRPAKYPPVIGTLLPKPAPAQEEAKETPQETPQASPQEESK